MRTIPSGNGRRLERVGGLTLILITLASMSFAEATMSWNAPAGGLWSEPGNWYPEQVPDWSDEVAVIGISGSYQVTVNALVWPHRAEIANPAALLRILDWAELGAGTVDNHGTIESTARHCGLGRDIVNHADGKIQVPSGTTMMFLGGTLTNNGMIDVNSDHGLDYAEYGINDPDGMTLAGFGQLILHGDGDPSRALITSIQGGWTQEADHRIHGDGSIFAPIVNHGLISSDVAGSAIILGGGQKTNTGILETLDGTKLDIMTSILQSGQGTTRAAGGTIRIFNGSRIEYGKVTTSGGGRIVGQPGTFVIGNSTCDATIDVLSGSRLIAGFSQLINDGTITLNPDGLSDDAVLQGYQYYNVVLGGTGQVVMRTGGDPGDARMETLGETIVNGPLHAIRGEGSITCPFNNHGHVSADVPGRMLRFQDGWKTNDGLIDAQSQGVLEIVGTRVTQTAPGAVRADGGTVRLRDGAWIINGELASSGTGRFEFTAGTSVLADLTSSATIDVLGGATLIAGYNLLTNDGTITLNPDRTAADAVLLGYQYHNTTLGGSGQLIMRTAGDPLDAQIASYGETVNNGAQHTIRGEGTISCPFNNHGRIIADAAGRILQLVSGSKQNDGTIEARDQGILEISGCQVLQSESGTVRADGATVRLQGGGSISGGAVASANGGRFVTMSGTTGIYNLTNSAAVDVTGGTQLRIGSGTIVNNGTITLNPGQVDDNAILACCDYCNVTIDGTGEIVMRTAGDVEDAELVTYGWYTVNGPTHTIRGEGAIHTTLQNQGTLRADVTGRTLLSTSEITNSGLALATDGGTLDIVARFVNQGIAEAGGGGTARFANISANYGGNNLQGGSWRVLAGSVMRLLGADIHTLTADLLLDGPGSSLVSDDGSSNALANLNAIAAGGKLAVRGGRALAVPGTLATGGILDIGAGSSLTVPGPFVQQADVAGAHATVDGLLASAQTVRVDGGILDGNGVIAGGLRNSGDVCPGHSPGTLTIQGDYEQAPGGTLTIELAGLGAGQFDRLVVTGQAVLGGTLAVRAIDGFQAHVGDAFVILTRGGGSGSFATVTSDLGSGLMAVAEVATGAVTIRIQANPADVQELDASGGADTEDGGTTPSIPTALRLSARCTEIGSAILLIELPEPAEVRVRIHDLSGRVVAELADRPFSAGVHDLHWDGITSDGRRLSSGVYFARADVRAARGVESRGARVILLR